jgi:ATP synthase protein I
LYKRRVDLEILARVKYKSNYPDIWKSDSKLGKFVFVNHINRENVGKINKYDVDLNDGFSIKPKMKRHRNDTDNDQSWYYLGIFGQIGFSIAIPIVIGLLIGSKLDAYFHTYPKMTLALLLVGIVISVAGFVGAIRKVLKNA